MSSVDAVPSTSPGTGFEIDIAFTGEKAQVYAQNSLLNARSTELGAAAGRSSRARRRRRGTERQMRVAHGRRSDIADILRNSGLMEVVELDVGSHRVFGFDGVAVALRTRRSRPGRRFDRRRGRRRSGVGHHLSHDCCTVFPGFGRRPRPTRSREIRVMNTKVKFRVL